MHYGRGVDAHGNGGYSRDARDKDSGGDAKIDRICHSVEQGERHYKRRAERDIHRDFEKKNIRSCGSEKYCKSSWLVI